METCSEVLNKIRNIKISFLEELPEHTTPCEYNQHLLLNRLSEAHNAYLILMDKKMYTDAMLIAGHILENCAIIDYIQQDEIKDKKRTQKYLAKNLVRTICDLLDFMGSDAPTQEANDTLNKLIDILAEHGELILKFKSTNHKELIEKLKQSSSNSEKNQILKDNYLLPVVEDYLRPLRTKIAKLYNEPDIKNKIILFHAAYCQIKHCSANIYALKKQQGNKYKINLNQYKDISVIIVYMCLDYIYNKAHKKRL